MYRYRMNQIKTEFKIVNTNQNKVKNPHAYTD